MALSVSQLSNPPTRSQITAWMLTRLNELGFQTTGWQEGRVQLSIINAIATVAASFVQVAADTVKNVYNSDAEGSALTLFSQSRFDNDRDKGTKTAGAMTFTSTATSPYTVTAGQLIIESSGGQQFTNITGGVIPAGGALDLNVQALLIGADGNIANGSQLSLVTPLSGVVVTNPGPGDVDMDGQDDPWYDLATGTDPEPDSTLRERNATKWGLLSTEKTATAYENLALEQTGVIKTKIVHDNPRGPGTVDVYVAAASSLVSLADKEAAQEAFADYTFGTSPDYPPSDISSFPSTVYVKDPDTLPMDFVVGVVFYDPQYTAEQVSNAMAVSLSDFVNLIPIGGYEYETDNGVVSLGDLLEVMEGSLGVRSVTLTTPSGNVPVGSIQLVTAPADWITGKLNFSAVTS